MKGPVSNIVVKDALYPRNYTLATKGNYSQGRLLFQDNHVQLAHTRVIFISNTSQEFNPVLYVAINSYLLCRNVPIVLDLVLVVTAVVVHSTTYSSY